MSRTEEVNAVPTNSCLGRVDGAFIICCSSRDMPTVVDVLEVASDDDDSRNVEGYGCGRVMCGHLSMSGRHYIVDGQ